LISLRIRWPYGGEEWTDISISGAHEGPAANLLGSALLQRDWEVLVSRDGGEEFELGGEEPEEEDS
jgi:hypothetical protein